MPSFTNQYPEQKAVKINKDEITDKITAQIPVFVLPIFGYDDFCYESMTLMTNDVCKKKNHKNPQVKMLIFIDPWPHAST